MDEIVRNAKRGLEEWGIYRGFDTNVREMCLNPAQELIFVAFYLLCDCLYDPETNYFYRKEDSYFAHNAMVYKFWDGQTGRGLLWFNAKMDEMERKENWLGTDSERFRIENQFLADVREHEKQRNEYWEKARIGFELDDSVKELSK